MAIVVKPPTIVVKSWDLINWHPLMPSFSFISFFFFLNPFAVGAHSLQFSRSVVSDSATP